MVVDTLDGEDFKFSFQPDLKIIEVLKQLPTRTNVRSEGYWRFPIIDLFILKKILKENGLTTKITEEAKQEYIKVVSEFKRIKDLANETHMEYKLAGMKPDVELYPFQNVGAKFLETVESGLMGMDMGLGKFQHVDSKLLTPNGSMRMGDIKVGDRVFGSDGRPHNVTGVFPQGKKKVYEVEFSDGSKTTSGDEHLWNIISPSQKWKGRKYKTEKLEDFKNDLYDKNGNKKWFIPMVSPIEFEEKVLQIDPYVLGALIGDGTLGTKNQVGFSSADSYLVNDIRSSLPEDWVLNKSSKYDYRIVKASPKSTSIVKIIEELNLNVKSEKKHIPDMYKFSSVEQRIALLQGLMDTDGGVDTKDGIVITYTSVSEKLADDVRFLVESLGGNAKKSSRIPSYTCNGKKNKGQRAYRLNISLPNSIIPFRLPRKKDKYKPRTKYPPYRAFKKVTYLGNKDCQCISVDSSDHLYVTDHFILTHNTITSISHAANRIEDKTADRILVICPSSVKIEWAIQLARFTGYSYTVVDGPDRMDLYTKQTRFIIMNYDLLWRDIDFLKEQKFDIIVADEIQRARNHDTGTFQAINQLQCNKRIGLTGTPLENDIMDLFTIMKFIDPRIFGSDETTFKYRYCVTTKFNQIVPGKYKNLDEINRKLSYVMFRRRKRDVLDDLPEKVTNNFRITLNKEERKIYEDVKSGILEDLEAGKVKMIHALAQITYLRQVCNCLNTVITKKKIVSSKFEELKKILKDIDTNDKVVIFSQYAKMGAIIEEHIGYKSVYLHGGVKQGCKLERELEKQAKKDNKKLTGRELVLAVHAEKQKAVCITCPYYQDKEKCHTRKKIMAQFNDPELGIRIFISTDAGKSGLNLQVANYIINYDLSFNPATNEQRIARVERIGQLKKIFVLNLVCDDTIENRVLQILSRKQGLFDRVIDNMTESSVERLVLNHKSIKDLL